MPASELMPTVGAALPIDQLPAHHDWILERQRDLEIQDPFNPEFLDGDWKPAIQQIKTLLTGYTGRMGIHGPFDGLALMSFDPKVRDLASGRLCQALEFAGEIGATHMVVHSPLVTFGHPFVPQQPVYKRSDLFGRVHETLRKPLELAAKIGCTLVMETILDTNPALWVELVKSFNSPNMLCSIDVGHTFIMHRTGGAPPDAYVREAAELLGHVHLQDTDGLTDRHWRPGLGNINWYAFFDALRSIDANPRLIIEIRDYAAVLDTAAYLKERGLAQ